MELGWAVTIIVGLLGLFGVVVTALLKRGTDAQANLTESFKTLVDSLERRVENLESEVVALRENDRRGAREKAALRRYIRKLLGFIDRHLPEIERELYAPDAQDRPLIEETQPGQ